MPVAQRGLFHEDDEYWPEFGTLTIRDDGCPFDGPLSQHESKAQPCGTIARTGNGWLEGSSPNGPYVVRVELHPAAPPDTGDWPDAVELPFLSPSGSIGLGYVTGGFTGDLLPLAGPGAYRVQVTRRPLDAAPVDDDDEPAPIGQWLLRFWQAPVEPPRWLRRSAPAPGRADPGWHAFFPSDVQNLAWATYAVQYEGNPATTENVREWGTRHGRPDDWLTQHVTHRYDHQLDVADAAAQLGRPAPTGLGDVLGLFTALGLLDQTGRTPAEVPFPEDVLRLPPERVEQLVTQREHNRFCSFASDLVSVAMWGSPTETLASLAERTLASEEDVRLTLDWAQRKDLLRVEGSLDGRFTLAC